MFPRPVSPRSAFADLKLMFSPDRPYRWSLLGLSVTLTMLLLWGFLHDSRIPERPREIIYVESWMADRKDSDIIRQQLKDLDTYEDGLATRQEQWQKVADAVGIEWREEEAANRARREEVMVAVRKQLNQKLADALAKEKAEGRTPAGETQGTLAQVTGEQVSGQQVSGARAP